MKKLLNKKGFTIVELVIVIAVIAVLAAVLIPTFSSLIEKANRSADIQAVKQMNTALSIESVGEKFEKVGEVIDSLEKSGISANNYKALAKGYMIVWDKEENKMLYVNSSYKVEFPEDCKGIEYKMGKWVTLDGKIKGDETWKTEVRNVTEYSVNGISLQTPENYQVYTISSSEQLFDLEQTLNSDDLDSKYGENGANMIIELKENKTYDMLGAEWTPIYEFAGVFNGNGATIENISMKNDKLVGYYDEGQTNGNPYNLLGFISFFSGQYFGNVTLEVDYDCPGDYKSYNHTVAGAIGKVKSLENGKTVYIDGVTVEGKIQSEMRVSGIVGHVGGGSLENGAQVMKGNVIIQNCVNNAEVTSTYCVNTHGTAAGIVSTTNYSDGDFIIRNCVNNGKITGLVSAGILANAWAYGCEDNNGGRNIYIYDNVNNGEIISRFDETISATPSIKVEKNSYAAGIYNSQADLPNHDYSPKNIYIFGNVNNGVVKSLCSEGSGITIKTNQIISNKGETTVVKEEVPTDLSSYEGTNITIDETGEITWNGDYTGEEGVNLSLYEEK